MCLERLDEYPRTLEGDQALMNREDLTVNQKNSLVLTISEKKVIHSTLEFVNNNLDIFLSKDPAEFLEHKIKEAKTDGTSEEWLNYFKGLHKWIE